MITSFVNHCGIACLIKGEESICEKGEKGEVENQIVRVMMFFAEIVQIDALLYVLSRVLGFTSETTQVFGALYRCAVLSKH